MLTTYSSKSLTAFRTGRLSLYLAVVTGLSTLPMAAATIAVPNGTFTNASNAGHIGGFFSSPISNQGIGYGNGPWAGNTEGILGTFAAPLLTISTTGGRAGFGSATISGIANLGGLLDDRAYFSQTLSTAYQANTLYTLSAEVSVGSAVSASALANAGVGIALSNGNGLNNILASTTTASSPLVSLSLLYGKTYQLTLSYLTGSSVSGNIGIDLLNTPSGLASSALFSSATFSNVSLNATSPTPEPATLAITGLALLAAGFARARRTRNPA